MAGANPVSPGRELNILHFALSFFPVTGGMTARIYNLIQNDGNRHCLVVPSSPSEYIPKEIKVPPGESVFDNIRVCREPLIPPTNGGRVPVVDYWQRWRRRQRNADRLLERAPGPGMDLIYGHGPTEFSTAALRYAAKFGRPIIFEVHSIVQDNLWLGQGWKRLYHRLMAQADLRVERRILRRARTVVVQTGSIRERIRTLYGVRPECIEILYNGVDTERFSACRHREEIGQLRDDLGAGGRLVVLYAGLLDRINGIRFFLDLYPTLPPSLSGKVLFVFAGKGEYAAELSDLSLNVGDVCFLGMLDYDRMPALMGAADVFMIPRPSCLPSETLLPIKLLEAMAMGRDVLVSDVRAMAEVVRDGVNGYVFRSDDAADFIQALERVVCNLSAGYSLGEAARVSAADRYSWASQRHRLREVYERALEPEGNGR
jgi:glycosyltransferase involved in cell wall biosynthesis